MSRHLLYPIAFLAVVGLAVLFGVVHTVIEAAITRHLRDADDRSRRREFVQPSHCHVRTDLPTRKHSR